MALLFSVIIPAYNSEAYVGEAIESALMQKGVKFEVIVVNDGSTDMTSKVLNSFKQNITVLNQANLGVSEARNNGVRLAKGNMIAFLDADDIWLPEKLLAQSIKIIAGYQVVYSNRANIGDIGDLPEVLSDIIVMNEGDIWADLLKGNMITTSSSVVDKELYSRLGGFRKYLHHCEDWDLWLRCAEVESIGYCSEPLVKYRITQGTLSSNYKSMCEMRRVVISHALSSSRGRQLSLSKKLQITASMWSTSGWEAAKNRELVQALKYYGFSLARWPFDIHTWYDVARVLAGRA
jgi:glycosyltransferase involved in cell wall biosynthesis